VDQSDQNEIKLTTFNVHPSSGTKFHQSFMGILKMKYVSRQMDVVYVGV